jgi:hypothetical protein
MVAQLSSIFVEKCTLDNNALPTLEKQLLSLPPVNAITWVLVIQIMVTLLEDHLQILKKISQTEDFQLYTQEEINVKSKE